MSFLQFVACAGIGLVFGFIGGVRCGPRSLGGCSIGSGGNVRWIFSAVALVALAFIAVGIVREQPLGEVQSKELRQFGYVMLVVTAVFALVWVLWEEPGVLT